MIEIINNKLVSVERDKWLTQKKTEKKEESIIQHILSGEGRGQGSGEKDSVVDFVYKTKIRYHQLQGFFLFDGGVSLSFLLLENFS